MTEIPASEAERLAILNEPDALEDLITPEHLLHMSDDELMGEAARFGRTLAKLDERQQRRNLHNLQFHDDGAHWADCFWNERKFGRQSDDEQFGCAVPTEYNPVNRQQHANSYEYELYGKFQFPRRAGMGG